MPDKPNNRPAFKTQTVKGSHYAYTRVDGRRLSLGPAGSPERSSDPSATSGKRTR